MLGHPPRRDTQMPARWPCFRGGGGPVRRRRKKPGAALRVSCSRLFSCRLACRQALSDFFKGLLPTDLGCRASAHAASCRGTQQELPVRPQKGHSASASFPAEVLPRNFSLPHELPHHASAGRTPHAHGARRSAARQPPASPPLLQPVIGRIRPFRRSGLNTPVLIVLGNAGLGLSAPLPGRECVHAGTLARVVQRDRS